MVTFVPIRRALTATGLAVSVASCGILGVNSNDPNVAYASAEERALLEIPPDLSGNVRQPLLRLPEDGKSKITHSTLLPDPESVRLVRDGSVRWLELDADARELWPELKNFFVRAGFAIARDAPLLGVIETEWRDAAGEGERNTGNLLAALFSGPGTGTRERFRLRLERITEGGNSVRLFLTQRRIEPVTIAAASSLSGGERLMVKRPPESERETEMLLQLLVYFGVRKQVAEGLLTANEAKQLSTRAYLEEVNGEETLVVADTHHRVWILAGEVLEDIGLEVENVVKSESRYDVLFEGVPPQTVTVQAAPEGDQAEEQGFFSGLFGDKNEIEQFYQVYVLEEPGRTRISIADTAGATPLPALKEDILQRLYEKLR